jgi:hypothetical protein
LTTQEIAAAAPGIPVPDPVRQRVLPENERLVYQVKWLGITAGEFVVEIKGRTTWKGRPCYVLEIQARTVGLASTLYRVEDLFRTYMDAEHFYALHSEEHRHEGGYHKDSVTEFDHAAGKAYFRNAADGSEKTFDIPPGVQDSLSVPFAARLLVLEPGRVFMFKVCNSEKVYDLYLSVQHRTKLKGAAVIHLVPYGRLNGEDFSEGRASGYVSDDERKIPVQFVVKAPVFTSVTATLVENPEK